MLATLIATKQTKFQTQEYKDGDGCNQIKVCY